MLSGLLFMAEIAVAVVVIAYVAYQIIMAILNAIWKW